LNGLCGSGLRSLVVQEHFVSVLIWLWYVSDRLERSRSIWLLGGHREDITIRAYPFVCILWVEWLLLSRARLDFAHFIRVCSLL